ncbi:hypothetical protein A3X38_14775 [Salmonella enterica subsp. enterica serovar Florida]|nr:hypothetical protein [Salmonella enterica subsp. enterica serovar Florida]
MQAEEFIRQNIVSMLAAEGFSSQIAHEAAAYGLDLYRRMSQPSRKGKAFDDCFYYARQWALGQTTKAERWAKKKPGGGTNPASSDTRFEFIGG